jgi:hypothetical protein
MHSQENAPSGSLVADITTKLISAGYIGTTKQKQLPRAVALKRK